MYENLVATLKEMGWSTYEASCYCALVRRGPLKASSIASEADVPNSKVYQPLRSLEEKDFVKLKSKNPKIYAAQHPRFVIEKEREDFEERSDKLLTNLEQTWEVGEDRGLEQEGASVLPGSEGVSLELARVLELAEDSVIGFDNNLAQISRNTFRRILEKSNSIDVKLVGGAQSKDRLESLVDNGAKARRLNKSEFASFYVIDGSKVIVQAGSGRQAIYLNDKGFGKIIKQQFEDIFDMAEGMDDG